MRINLPASAIALRWERGRVLAEEMAVVLATASRLLLLMLLPLACPAYEVVDTVEGTLGAEEAKQYAIDASEVLIRGCLSRTRIYIRAPAAVYTRILFLAPITCCSVSLSPQLL